MAITIKTAEQIEKMRIAQGRKAKTIYKQMKK